MDLTKCSERVEGMSVCAGCGPRFPSALSSSSQDPGPAALAPTRSLDRPTQEAAFGVQAQATRAPMSRPHKDATSGTNFSSSLLFRLSTACKGRTNAGGLRSLNNRKAHGPWTQHTTKELMRRRRRGVVFKVDSVAERPLPQGLCKEKLGRKNAMMMMIESHVQAKPTSPPNWYHPTQHDL